MSRSVPLIIVTVFFYLASLAVFARDVHKWVDKNGVTHYSDEVPASSEIPVTRIEVPETYSTAADIENDYYSITNQWMRVHEERIALEQIKLEKAKQKASQRVTTPQIVYVNDPDDNRYVIANPRFFPRKSKHQRFNHAFNHRSDGEHVKHHSEKHSHKFLSNSRRADRRQFNRKSSGLELVIN